MKYLKLKYLTNVNIVLTVLLLFLYAFVRIYNNFFEIIPPHGDESSFLPIFELFTTKGFYAANVFGNSTVYNFTGAIYYYFTGNLLLSLRLNMLFFGIASLVFIYYLDKKFFKKTKKNRLIALVISSNILIVNSVIFSGYNDPIIYFLTVLYFFVIFSIKRNKPLFILLGIVFGLLISTRLMVILLIPSIMYTLYITLKKTLFSRKIILLGLLKTFLAFLITVFILNYPSLVENGSLSFHVKKPASASVTWSQMQYLAALGQSKGEVKYNHHFSWSEVEEYVKINGEDSLPKTFFSSIFFDFRFTLIEFIKDSFLLIIPYTRLLGVLFLVAILYCFTKFHKKSFFTKLVNNQLLMFFLIYSLTISFVIISNVEVRWLVNILILLPMLIIEKLPNSVKIFNVKILFKEISINLGLISIFVMNIPFVIKSYNIFF